MNYFDLLYTRCPRCGNAANTAHVAMHGMCAKCFEPYHYKALFGMELTNTEQYVKEHMSDESK